MKETDQHQVLITRNPSLEQPDAVNVQVTWQPDWRRYVLTTREYPSMRAMRSQINREVLFRKAQIVSGLLGTPLLFGGFLLTANNPAFGIDTPARVLLGLALIGGSIGSFRMACDGIIQLHAPWTIQQKIKEVVKADYTILPTSQASQLQP